MVDVGKIKKYMIDKNLTQGALAKLVNTSEPTMSNYFRGKVAWDIGIVVNTCNVLEIPVTERGQIFLI